MKYTLNWLERKTTAAGKNMIKATFVEGGEATIWEGFPNFENLKPGSEVEGDIVEKQNGTFTNRTLYAPRSPQTGSGTTARAAVMEKAIERKEKSIERFQDEKELSIKIASTFRGAVDMAVAEYQENRRLSASATGATLEQLFHKWRDFLWANYEVRPEEQPPFPNTHQHG